MFLDDLLIVIIYKRVGHLPRYQYIYLVNGIQCLVLCIAFASIGILTLKALKTHFKEFYFQNFREVSVATILLSFPLLLRVTFNITGYYNEEHKFLDDDDKVVVYALYQVFC